MIQIYRIISIVCVWTAVASLGCSVIRFGGTSTSQSKDPASTRMDAPNKAQGPDSLDVDRDRAITPGPGTIQTQATESSCLMRRADFYNFVLVFDASSSTNNTDEGNIRRASALRFADKMAKLAALGPKPEIQVATVAFNRDILFGPHSWLKLGVPQALIDLSTDIATITTDAKAGTHFDLAFGAASTLLQKRNASGTDKRQRNYWIFLSDGQANGSNDDKDELVATLQPYLTSLGVALVGIAAGDDLSSRGKEKMQAVSMPTAGIVAPDHVGRYYEAPTAQSLDKAWDDLYNAITQCDGKP